MNKTELVSQYSREEFELFAKGLKKVSDILKSEKPDYIFAPVGGSVPLIDLLSIIDRHFPIENTEFPPNSSRFYNREEIMSRWYKNFLEKNYIGERLKIVCIDEVVSGSSAVKGYNEFKKAVYEFGNERKEKLDKNILYKIIGIGEVPKRGKRNKGFNRIVNQKKACVIDVDKIITCDNPLLNPIRFKIERTTKNGRYIYKPEIEAFEYSQHYLKLLREFAEYFGIDPNSINPITSKVDNNLKEYLKEEI